MITHATTLTPTHAKSPCHASSRELPNPHPTGELKRPFGAKGALPELAARDAVQTADSRLNSRRRMSDVVTDARPRGAAPPLTCNTIFRIYSDTCRSVSTASRWKNAVRRVYGRTGRTASLTPQNVRSPQRPATSERDPSCHVTVSTGLSAMRRGPRPSEIRIAEKAPRRDDGPSSPPLTP